MKNEALNTDTYNQYWKHSPSDQSILNSSVDYKTRINADDFPTT